MPRITISIHAPGHGMDQELLTLDVPPDSSVRDLKSIVQAETDFPMPDQVFYLNGQELKQEAVTLEAAGLKDGEMLAMLVRKPGAAGASQAQGGRPGESRQTATAAPGRRAGSSAERFANPDQIETLRLRILGDPKSVADFKMKHPELADALPDPARFREMWFQLARKEEELVRERQNQIALLNEDPFNVEAQRKIEEMIRQERVIENLQHAYENNPAVFGRVTMLYVNAEVNGHPIKAFVDSGAQVTIMSPSCAETCNIMRLIDKRYSGIAKGVGTAKILGRVHHAEIKIGSAVMPSSFTVMEGKDVDLLFGLDMLKRFKAKIDLERNVLAFQDGIEVPFLPESEIPKSHEDAALREPTLAGPNGTEIGAVSGAVQPAGTAAQHGGGAAAAGPSNPRGLQRPAAEAGTGEVANFPTESIDQLTTLGFSKDQAIRALRATNGNVEYAAVLLSEIE